MERDRASPVFLHHRHWRAKPLISHQVIVQLIGATTTKAGLKVRCQLDPAPYPPASVSDDDLAAVSITRREFHGEWNCTSSPKQRPLQRQFQDDALKAFDAAQRADGELG